MYIGNTPILPITAKCDSAFIRYSANADGTDFTEEWSEGQNYIGFATGQEAPTNKSEYQWVELPSSSGTGEGSSIVVDDSLSETSENPVQNKVVTGAIKAVNEVLNGTNLELTGTSTGWNRFSVNIKTGTELTFTSQANGCTIYLSSVKGQTVAANGQQLVQIPTANVPKAVVANIDVVEIIIYGKSLTTITTQGLEHRTTALENVIDETNQAIIETRKWNNAININFASQEQNKGFRNIDGWYALTTNATHCVIPIMYGMRVKVHANKDYDTGVFFASEYSLTEQGVKPNATMISSVVVALDTTQTISVPYGSKYVIVNVIDQNNKNRLPQSMSIEFDEEWAEIYRNAKTKNLSVQFGEPITILANNDDEAVDQEKLRLSYFNIVQLSDKMYYLYYEGKGANDTGMYQQNILFAYSTDGINYTRGFPEGITPPIEGTNKILSYTNCQGQTIFKCLDAEYPWRMVFQHRPASGTEGTNVYMLKSKDGINFVESTRRLLQTGIHDTQYGVVCRGSVMKIYSRINVNYNVGGVTHKSREITVAYYDLDGNMLSPEKTLPLKYVYNSSAMPIDDRHEIIIPTGFDNTTVNGVKDDSCTLNVYGVDGYLLNEKVDTNISSIVEESDKWILFSPSMITIGGTQYLAYMTWDFSHDTAPTLGTSVSRYRIVPIVIDRE